MKKRTPPLAKAILTPDDVWWREVCEVCARSGAKWLKSSVNVKRPIDTLKLSEMQLWAEHVISTWIVEASKREASPPDETPSTATFY